MNIRRGPTVAILLLLLFGPLAAAEEQSVLRDGHPDQYVVKEGDTLWGVASKFLTDPWLWPEIWHVNPEIENPHLIYPGDEILLKYVGGDPQLSVKRGPGSRTVKLSPNQQLREGDRYEKFAPRIRSSALSGAIPAIPLDAVASLMSTGRIVEQDTLALAPRILAGRTDRLVFGPGDEFYGRGTWQDDTSVYGIFRDGNVYIDPETKEILGYEAIEVGLARAKSREGDVVTFTLTSVKEDVRIGDRLLPTEERRLESTFYPTPPEQSVEGVIMTVLGGVTQVGRNDVVVINRGQNVGVDVGTVLAIYKRGPTVRDKIYRDTVELPAERARHRLQERRHRADRRVVRRRFHAGSGRKSRSPAGRGRRRVRADSAVEAEGGPDSRMGKGHLHACRRGRRHRQRGAEDQGRSAGGYRRERLPAGQPGRHPPSADIGDYIGQDIECCVILKIDESAATSSSRAVS